MRYYKNVTAITVLLAVGLAVCGSSAPPDVWTIMNKLPAANPSKRAVSPRSSSHAKS